MNIRDITLNIGIACLAVMAFNYFFPAHRASEEASSVAFTVPKDSETQRPLNIEIDFIGSKRPQQEVLTEVETTWGILTFSTEGASLESLEHKRPWRQSAAPLRTVFPKNDAERDQRCWMIGFDAETPFYYLLLDQIDTEDSVMLVYKAETEEVVVLKKFMIDKLLCKVDMSFEVTPKNGVSLTPRVLFSAPVLPELGDQETISGIFMSRDGVFEKIERSQVPEDKGWLHPAFFGTEDRYFLHTLIADPNQFAHRAYYGLRGKNGLITVLEGPTIQKTTSWNLSFYFGPKDSDSIDSVDIRLEKTLDYSGILAPISKLILKTLKWLYSYVHNFGLAIMLLILLINLILLPISLKGKERMKQQQEMQKKLAYLQQRYKNDPDRLNLERMELIKKHGMPGLSGCLPLLLQMPLFFAFSRVLGNSIALYQAPMLWIQDLSSADPYYVLPFLVMLAMLLSSLSVEPKQRASIVVMALVFGAITAKLSAGLALYFALNTLLGVIQTRMVPLIKS